MASDAEEAMFELLTPAPHALPEVKPPRMGAIGAKWTRYGGTHRPCDLCVRRIHEHGVTGAPPPNAAAHKRVGPNDTMLLCNVDAEEQKRKDADAEARYRLRVAANTAKAGPRKSTGGRAREGMS